MSESLPALPVLIPLLTAIVCLLNLRSRRFQRATALLGAAGLLAAAVVLLRTVWYHGIQVVQIGSWPAPYGITLVADVLAAVMVLLAGIVGLAVVYYSLFTVDVGRESCGYYPLLHILLMGVCGAFLTGDLFNLYVWFEVMLIASFVLLAMGGERAQLEGAIKYVTLNLMSSSLFLTAIGILYSLAGTLNMADLAVKLRAVDNPGLVTAVAVLFLASFGIKAAVFPLFFWLPASYHVPPVAVSAIFAGLLTKVGVYAMIRSFTLIFRQDVDYTHSIVLWAAGLTMISGVLGAAAQNEFRRILSFHIISQIGYMIMGLGLMSPLALAGSVFYIVHHIIVKTNLFLISGMAYRLRGTGDLAALGGWYQSRPLLSALFIVPAFSLAGLPPLSGFFAKLTLVKAGLELEQYAIVAIALVVGLLTLYSMTKIWAEVFWKPAPDAANVPDARGGSPAIHDGLLLVPVAALAIVTVAIGLGAGHVFQVALRAAEQLLDSAEYVSAVLGGSQ